MALEPINGKHCHVVQRARLFEQVGGAGDPPVLDERLKGVYGSIRARKQVLERLRVERNPKADLAALQELADESLRRLTALADSLPEPATKIQHEDGQRAAATVLTQLFMHGAEHRGHISTILGALGIEGPELDSWGHGIFVHGDDWPADWGQKLDPMPLYPPPELS